MKLVFYFSMCIMTLGWAQKNYNPELANCIDSLYVVDQKVQNDIINAMRNGVTPSEIKNLVEVEDETFFRHIPLLKMIVKKNGYPTSELVGKESSSKFFILVQHSDADLAFQEEMMKYIEREVLSGNVSGRDFAYLYDRILLASNNQQLYGTQLEYDKSGNAKPRDLFDPENCNKRREKYGLEPIEEYLEFATELHKEMNKRN